MIIYPLCSSSKGNCTYIGNDKEAILIDAGFGIKNTFKSLELAGISKNNIKAIFITHEHSDHISGLYSLTKVLSIPVYSSKDTLQALLLKNCIYPGTKLYEINLKKAIVANMEISAFHTPHDSAYSLGFSFFDGLKTFSICTDLGYVSNDIKNHLKSSDFILLESNYDYNMLQAGNYPYAIKQRIQSKHGHLSNDETAYFVEYLIKNGVKKFLLGHLSQKNNLPQLAMQTVISHLLKNNIKYQKDYFLNIAPVRNTGILYRL